MSRSKDYAKDFLAFIDKSPSAFHAVKNIASELTEFGYQELSEKEKWPLEPGGKYFVMRNGSSLISFHIGTGDLAENGFRLIGAHTDSPGLKIKPETFKNKNGYIAANVEVYGGPIVATWLDRPLSVAGRITCSIDGEAVSKTVDFEEPIAIVPNAAIHVNRDINKGFEYNRQNHLQMIFALASDRKPKEYFLKVLADKAGVNSDDILDYDLFAYDAQKSLIIGTEGEFISAGRLDNLAMCHAVLKITTEIENPISTFVGLHYDNEEIGSTTLQGANSSFAKDILERISANLTSSKEDFYRATANSFQISADGAHAVHPGFAEKHDPDYQPLLNGGPVIKQNANFRYATTSETSAYFENLCRKANVKCQKMMNRSDIPSGSTIGPMSSSILGIKTVDVGNPMLAMHSVREMCGTEDHEMMIRVFREFAR
ncbi:MAG: M18 family aminopeptidase [Candidatus Cloacimonadota bacterium]|nr:MAG: M18 family aminopeptidase [Candidatus Cloacimonadota bacterium]